MADEYDRVAAARDFLLSRLAPQPQAGIVLGSGLGEIAAEIQQASAIPYKEIPHWPCGEVAGHAGEWISGELAGAPVAVLSGRAHLYEGYSAAEVVFGIRVLGLMGARSLILTNASGAINRTWKPGQLALLSDHINLLGANPLAGPNDERFGPRFPDLSEPYSARYREFARQAAAELEIALAEGVYAAVLGPNYETPAEVRFLSTAGADMVGMSTVPETIAARHMGIEVLGISVIANLAAGMKDQTLSHEEVLAAGESAAPNLAALLTKAAPKLWEGGPEDT